MVGLLAQGQACPEAACALAGACLVAVPKPKGGIRPIAIGELLRRLTGKCLMTQVRTAAREHLFPEQVGLAVPSGAEAVVHTVRAWLARHSGSTQKVLVKLDFENAFNTLSRQQVLGTVTHPFPELARWVSWCYSRETWLQFGQSTLRSAAGVQQGDPLGPLLFATALQPLAQELRQTSLDLSVFYLDDGVLAGDLPTVAAALPPGFCTQVGGPGSGGSLGTVPVLPGDATRVRVPSSPGESSSNGRPAAKARGVAGPVMSAPFVQGSLLQQPMPGNGDPVSIMMSQMSQMMQTMSNFRSEVSNRLAVLERRENLQQTVLTGSENPRNFGESYGVGQGFQPSREPNTRK